MKSGGESRSRAAVAPNRRRPGCRVVIPALLRWRIDVVVGKGRVVKPHRVNRRVPATSFVGYRFPPEVILLTVRWYLRYRLSYRDVEELLAERGVAVDHVTI